MTAPATALRYSAVRDYVAPKLADGGFDVVMDAGPSGDADLQKLSPNATVFLTVGGGAGLSFEGAYDRVFIAAHVVGPQGDYDAAESLALALDAVLMALEVPDYIGASRSLYVARAGGRPALLMRDSANRYHFTCSYITETTSGL